MGIRGLTTFIANRSRQYMDDYNLHDCYVVLDASSIACQLYKSYKWSCKYNDCFGGDYDKYGQVVLNFFQLLSDCNITPLVIFDGGYEKRKMGTVISRMKNKIGNIQRVSPVVENGSTLFFPLFTRKVFTDVVLKLGVKCVRCKFESDGEAAYVAKTLNCPLISFDSDFYIFDVLYIPFPSLELKLRKTKNRAGKVVNFIKCQMYSVQKFLNSFGGLNKANLPLLSVLLGNDYIKKQVFSVFYRQMKLTKIKGQNEQQRRIKTVIQWLQSENIESAIKKILGRYKQYRRKEIYRKIEEAMKSYYCENSEILQALGICPAEHNTSSVLPNFEEIEQLPDVIINDQSEGTEEMNSASDEIEENDDDEEEEQKQAEALFICEQNQVERSVPLYFGTNYKKGILPGCFMDMLTCDTYLCVPQIEDLAKEHSHTMNFNILSAIHKILTLPDCTKLICISRSDNSGIKRTYLDPSDKLLPSLAEIETMDIERCKSTLLGIVNLDDSELKLFPNSWHLFIISLKYWIVSSGNQVELPYIYSAILCAIIINYVDKKVGFYRCLKQFRAKYSKYDTIAKGAFNPTSDILECINKIDTRTSVACLENCLTYFQVDEKMKGNYRLFDRSIVHKFAQFQSCLLHVKYLNSLLKSPFEDLLISDFFNGTFLYNMSVNLGKRTDLKVYLQQTLLPNALAVFHACQMMIETVQTNLTVDISDHVSHRRRRRKKKKKTEESRVSNEVIDNESDEEHLFDANNKFSLLSSVTM